MQYISCGDVNLAGCHHSTTTLLCGAAPLSPGVREVNDRFDDTVVIILLAKQPRQVTLKVQSSLISPSLPPSSSIFSLVVKHLVSY